MGTTEAQGELAMWLILGGEGQLGRSMQDSLSSLGVPYVSTGRKDVDIADLSAVRSVINNYAPEVIINAAAWTAVDDAEVSEDAASLVNCIGVRNVALIAAEQRNVLVHISTDYVFSGSDTTPISEEQKTDPINAYGRTKLAGEKAIREIYPEGSLIIRTAWLYGQFGHNFARTMVKKALANQPVRVVNDQRGQPTFSCDLANHIVALVKAKAPSGLYHGTSQGDTTWYEFAREIYRLTGSDPDLVAPVPASEYPTLAKRPAYSVLDHKNTEAARIALMAPWLDTLTAAIPLIVANIDEA